MRYPKNQYYVGQETSLLQCQRKSDKVVDVKPDLPCNVIVVHGVNDVGVAYGAVEEGLCAGLDARLFGSAPGKPGRFVPGSYSVPSAKDKDVVHEDPDDVFFKRKPGADTHSPVIPFYWGFREVGNEAGVKNGQRVDRYGNRLDKDLSKGGGPFGNATSSLPDMWNRGIFSPIDLGGDPVRPLRSAPGRMYMVLAAKRLAALVAMIRDYDANEVVNIVAHSQGCLVTLLAQAFLLDEGQRPADTLILTHPPYSLEETTGFAFGFSELFQGGTDPAMEGQYGALRDRQTFDARLRTLANIVQGVAAKKHTTPAFASLGDHARFHGMVGARWSAGNDRDNRGKVYLYFCPEDMTVALDNMKGIGWQGVPDYMSGTALSVAQSGEHSAMSRAMSGRHRPTETRDRKPLEELGKGFFQRVFTAKRRRDLTGKLGPVLVGVPRHDFVMRIKGEDDHAHVADANRTLRAHHKEVEWPRASGPMDIFKPDAEKREGLRTISGEPLRVPVPAELRGSQIDQKNVPRSSRYAGAPAEGQGPYEEVDPIDAAIAITSGSGLKSWSEECPDPSVAGPAVGKMQALSKSECKVIEEQYNKRLKLDNLEPQWHRTVTSAIRQPGGKVIAQICESPNEARRRWQNEVSPKSFHSTIFGSAANHRNVTAYDMSIGGGKASSDPKFHAYLCAVADWRLQTERRAAHRPSITRWIDFAEIFNAYLQVEPSCRKDLILDAARYYSTGTLPRSIPGIGEGLPKAVICQTVAGAHVRARENRTKIASN